VVQSTTVVKLRCDVLLQEVVKNIMKHKNEKLRKERRAWLLNYKAKSKCVVCGEDNPACLDFHHKNPKEKDILIGRASAYSLDRIKAEVKKCVIICANCHRKLHFADGKYGKHAT